MSYNLFDDFEDEIQIQENVKPFYKVDEKTEKEKLDWLKLVKDALMQQSQSRISKQRMHLSWYRGISPHRHERDRQYNSTRRLSRINKFIVNHLHDLTETKVSQMTRLKPAVEVLPANDEWEDRSSAKVVSALIKHLWDINDIDALSQQKHRFARIFGESFLFVLWDKNKGDLHPAYVEAKRAGLEAIEINGELIPLDKEIRTGDISYELEVPWRVFLQRTNKFEKAEYLFRVKVEPTAKLQDQYPDKKDKIKCTDELRIYDIEDLQHKYVEKHTVVYEFFHKATDDLPKGKYIKFTDHVLLEEDDSRYSHGKLPIVRLTDLDVPEIMNGVSRYESIGPIQKMIDNLSTLLAKNIYLTAHPKWMMPRGACKIDALGNDNTIVQYQGPIPPTLQQVQPNSPEVYSFRQGLIEEMQTIYGSHGISRGEVPKGITAASALQFLNELESERASTDISKHGTMIKEIAKMTIAVAGDYYDINDGRMVRIVGEKNKYLIRHFDTANLNKNYDIRFDNSTGLPETKAAKTQRLLDMMQRNPNLFTPERWEELLDIGDTEKAVSLASEAIRNADSENEDLMAGEPVALPEEFEDHIAHWNSHVKAMQSRSFKEESTDEVYEAMREHVFETEELMIEKASNSPLFQSQLANLKLFPIYHHDNFAPPASKEHQEAMVQGQSNRGEPVSGMIPGTDADIREVE